MSLKLFFIISMAAAFGVMVFSVFFKILAYVVAVCIFIGIGAVVLSAVIGGSIKQNPPQ